MGRSNGHTVGAAAAAGACGAHSSSWQGRQERLVAQRQPPIHIRLAHGGCFIRRLPSRAWRLHAAGLPAWPQKQPHDCQVDPANATAPSVFAQRRPFGLMTWMIDINATFLAAGCCLALGLRDCAASGGRAGGQRLGVRLLSPDDRSFLPSPTNSSNAGSQTHFNRARRAQQPF